MRTCGLHTIAGSIRLNREQRNPPRQQASGNGVRRCSSHAFSSLDTNVCAKARQMFRATIPQAPTLSDEQIDRVLDETAASFAKQLRSPILHLPSQQNLDYEEVSFPALDGVPLEA